MNHVNIPFIYHSHLVNILLRSHPYPIDRLLICHQYPIHVETPKKNQKHLGMVGLPPIYGKHLGMVDSCLCCITIWFKPAQLWNITIFLGKATINGSFSIALSNYQATNNMRSIWTSTGLVSLVSAHGVSGRIRFHLGCAAGNPRGWNHGGWYGFTWCDML